MTEKMEEKKELTKRTKNELNSSQKNKECSEKKTEAKKSDSDSKDIQIQELTNDLKRVQADFSNYCKRADKDKTEFIEYASASFICKLLPIVDELEIALKNIRDSEDKKGIQMVYDKIQKVLKEEGVKEIQCVGEKLDPYKHEAMLFEESDSDGIVLEEIQKGYTIKGKVLRYAKVKVSKELSDNNEKPESAPKNICQDSKQSLEGE